MVSCQIVSTVDQLLDLEGDWRWLAEKAEDQDFYLTWDWIYAVVCLSQTPPNDPRIMVLRRGEELQAIIPCMLVQKKLRWRLVRSLELLGNIYSPRRGALMLPGRESEIARWFTEFLLTTYRDEWDLLDFLDLSPRDGFIATFTGAAEEVGLRPERHDLFVNIVAEAAPMESSDHFYAGLSKSTRGNINKRINKLNRCGRFALWLFHEATQDNKTALAGYRTVYSNSWKEPEVDPVFHDNLAQYLSRRGAIRIFFLCYQPREEEEEGTPLIPSRKEGDFLLTESPPGGLEPIASIYCIVHRQRAYMLKNSYSEAFADLSPGLVLWWFSIKHLLDIDHCAVIDHQKGDEYYKLLWNGKVHEIRFRLRFTNPKAVGLRIEMAAVRFLKKIRSLVRMTMTDKGTAPGAA